MLGATGLELKIMTRKCIFRFLWPALSRVHVGYARCTNSFKLCGSRVLHRGFFHAHSAKELHVSWRFPDTASPFSLMVIAPVQSMPVLWLNLKIYTSCIPRTCWDRELEVKPSHPLQYSRPIGMKASGTTGGYPGRVPSFFISITTCTL